VTQSRNTLKIRRAFTIASESRALKWVQLEVIKRYTSSSVAGVAAKNKLVVPGSKTRMASKASRTTQAASASARSAEKKKSIFHPIFAVYRICP